MKMKTAELVPLKVYLAVNLSGSLRCSLSVLKTTLARIYYLGHAFPELTS